VIRHKVCWDYSCFSAGTYPTDKERDAQMFHSELEYGLGKERVVEMRKEVERERQEARLREEERLAKVSLSEQTVFHQGRLTRGTTFVGLFS
jgi:hypothetical protein